MIKTQVQIPDELYRRAKKVAKQNEWSFAEVVRRGLQYITAVRGPSPDGDRPRKLPKPRNCGQFLVPEVKWTEASHD